MQMLDLINGVHQAWQLHGQKKILEILFFKPSKEKKHLQQQAPEWQSDSLLDLT